MTDGRDTVLDIDAITPNPRNARKHSDDQISKIMRSVQTYGVTTRILVDEDGMILAGHGRHAAYKRLGLIDIPVRIAEGWTEEEKAAYVIADNRLAELASWDEGLLAGELAGLLEVGADATLTGFTDAEIAAILDPGEGPAVAEVHTSEVSDRFWISVRGPLEAQAAMLDAVKGAAAGVFDVEIDVGSIAIGD